MSVRAKVINQGDDGSEFFVIMSGEASVHISADGGAPQKASSTSTLHLRTGWADPPQRKITGLRGPYPAGKRMSWKLRILFSLFNTQSFSIK